MKYRKLYLLLILAIIYNCSPKFYKPGKSSISDHVFFLASGSLEGRKSGEKGDSMAAEYIRQQFVNNGLQLLYEKGFQPFSLVTSVNMGPANHLSFNGMQFVPGVDFQPYSFSSNGFFEGGIAFAGYGLEIDTDSLKWNDYAGMDVSGKWVLVLNGDPESDKSESFFGPHSDERSKVLTAVDHRASGILLVGGPKYREEDKLSALFYDKNSSTYPVPIFQVTRNTADKILKGSETTVAELEAKAASHKTTGFYLKGSLKGRADVIQKVAETRNVAALLPGNDPVLKNEYIVLGAHYDHLGWGGPGSGSRVNDTVAIHHGADDNASGVAAILEISRMASMKKENRRSLIFVAFGAEEMGLLGSGNFMDHSPVDPARMVAMFNFDMVGRLDSTNSLAVGGTKTSLETEEILKRLNPGFNLAFSEEGFGPSDHASFYARSIPVFFFSTGAHLDYHTPGDVAGKINPEGIKGVADYAFQVVEEVSNRNLPLTFRESGSKMKRSRGQLKVTLGIMPDFAGMEKKGLRIDAITKGKPADMAGLLKGDILTAIDGKPVANIYDYMNRLKNLMPGQTISVDLIRDGKKIVKIVGL